MRCCYFKEKSDIWLKSNFLEVFFSVGAKYPFGTFCNCCCCGFNHMSPVGKQDLCFLTAVCTCYCVTLESVILLVTTKSFPQKLIIAFWKETNITFLPLNSQISCETTKWTRSTSFSEIKSGNAKEVKSLLKDLAYLSKCRNPCNWSGESQVILVVETINNPGRGSGIWTEGARKEISDWIQPLTYAQGMSIQELVTILSHDPNRKADVTVIERRCCCCCCC